MNEMICSKRSYCKYVSFNCLRNKTIAEYNINNFKFQIMCDLGVLLSSILIINVHINVIYRKALSAIGFKIQNCFEFKNLLLS
jgi:hypothetical protein